MAATTGSSMNRPMGVMEQRVRTTAASLWWLPLIRGILLILFGAIMFAWPGATLISLITFLGAYWLVGGVFDVVQGIVGETFRSRTWLIIGGLVSILAGFVVMSQPVLAGLLTTNFIVYTVAILAVVAGVLHLFAGRDGSFSWGSFFLGVLYIVFGAIVLFNPLLTGATLVWMLPVWAIVTGIFTIVAAFMLRRVDDHI